MIQLEDSVTSKHYEKPPDCQPVFMIPLQTCVTSKYYDKPPECQPVFMILLEVSMIQSITANLSRCGDGYIDGKCGTFRFFFFSIFLGTGLKKLGKPRIEWRLNLAPSSLFPLDTGPRKSFILELSDAKVYAS